MFTDDARHLSRRWAARWCPQGLQRLKEIAMRRGFTIIAALLLSFTVVTTVGATTASAVTPPPAPAFVAPPGAGRGAGPFTVRWGALVDPDGPIASYTWQVGTS